MTMTPLPGNPSLVEARASRMKSAAAQMRSAAATLLNLSSSGSNHSEAVEALSANTNEMALVLTKAAIRYQGTGDALAEYAPKLEAAQTQANTAIAQLGSTDVDAARNSLHSVERPVWETMGMDDADRAQYDADVAKAEAELADQRAAAAAAMALYQDAIRDIDVAARDAMNKIHDAAEQSEFNDSLWDDFKGFLADIDGFLQALITVLDVIADIIGLIGVILAFVPGLQALAGLLLLVSTGLSLITLGLTALRALSGKATWGDVLSKAIVTGVGLLIKGGGLAKTLGGSRLGALAKSMKLGTSSKALAADSMRFRLAFKFRDTASKMPTSREAGKTIFDYRAGGQKATEWGVETGLKWADKGSEAFGPGGFTFTLSDLVFDTSMGDRSSSQWMQGASAMALDFVSDPAGWAGDQLGDFAGDFGGWLVDGDDLGDAPIGQLLGGDGGSGSSYDFNIDNQPCTVSGHSGGGGGGGGSWGGGNSGGGGGGGGGGGVGAGSLVGGGSW